jgi:hypothetical protein
LLEWNAAEKPSGCGKKVLPQRVGFGTVEIYSFSSTPKHQQQPATKPQYRNIRSHERSQ